MLVNYELLKMVSEEKIYFHFNRTKHSQDIGVAVNIFKDNNCPFELMHCVSTYPMKDEDANLKTIETLRENLNVKSATVVMRQDWL